MRLKGSRAIVTGGSQGLGLAIARKFVEEGAHVVICGRDPEPLEHAHREIQCLRADARVIATSADVSKPEAVDALVALARQELGGVDALICSAGVHGAKGALETVDWDEWKQAIEINLFGAVLACRAVVPIMKAQGRGKIVLLSGGGATKPMPRLSAYAASKAAVVRFGETLAQELEAWNIDVNAVAPGAVNTRLLNDILEAGPERVGAAFHARAQCQKAEGGTPPSLAAELCVFLASDRSNGISGRLLSAVWDPWDRLPELAERLRETDIYTLRRIVPNDRGAPW